MGYGKGDVLPVAVGQNVLLCCYPLFGGFEAAGEHALDGESGPFADTVTEFFEELIPAFLEGKE